MPEVEKEVPKGAVDSYLARDHTGEELINYAHYGFWKSQKVYTQEESDRIFLRNHPKLIFNDFEENKKLFSEDEFEELLKKAHESSDGKD